MRSRLLPLTFLPYRRALTLVVVVAQSIVAFGIPLPTSVLAQGKSQNTSYPCQSRACGCLTAEQWWAGDCCCFTLEQKLSWAEANGIEPPDHVRPAVKVRKSQSASVMPCCSEPGDLISSPHAERSTSETPSTNSCCERKEDNTASVTESAQKRHETSPNTTDAIEWHWVAGFSAQKCRGEGPTGFLNPDPSIPPVLIATHPGKPVPGTLVCITSTPVTFTSHRPPTPPPRKSSQS
jgi:hypothetical protein